MIVDKEPEPETQALVRVLTPKEQMALTLKMEVAELSDKEVESFLVGGNLAVSPKTQMYVYAYRCERMGLNPVDHPLTVMTFNNVRVLYAKKECAEMLSFKHGVAIEILRDELTPEFYTVHVRARMPDDRFPEGIRTLDNMACVPLLASGKLEIANKKMACISKALRRVTLAITGCGLSDSDDAPPGARSSSASGQPVG